ncbi:MAG: hypothetical protein EHM40_19395, partial [Chloroflexi bacterium]
MKSMTRSASFVWQAARFVFAAVLILQMVGVPIQPVSASTLAMPRFEPIDCADVTEIPQAECEALAALYNSTNGAGWTNHTDWLETGTPCSWYGVWCSPPGSNRHVTSLHLSANNLVGNIPASIDDLPGLQYFTADNNQLSGTLPPEIGTLTSLVGLSLSNNNITGPIPSEFGSLTNLQSLWLNSNSLTGPIPEALGYMTSIAWLVLSDNELTGAIPSSLGDLANLNNLDISTTNISGQIPASLGVLSNLQGLQLSDTQLSGSIPGELGGLTSLRGLSLYNTQLTGNVPSEIGQLINLESLQLGNTLMAGEIPVSITSLTKLAYLTLNCGLTSTDPAVIAFLDARVPNWWQCSGAQITVQPDHGWVSGSNWPFGITITLTLDDDTDPNNGTLYQESKVTGPAPWNPNQSYVQFQPEETLDLAPGQYVTLTDGTFSKSMWIEDVVFVNVNTETDIAIGRGPALHHANVDIGSGGGSWLHVGLLIGGDGNWTADFGAQGTTIPDDFDDAHITVFDEDGDNTMAHFQPPRIRADGCSNRVSAENWTVGTEITLTIDDVSNGPGLDYSDSGTVLPGEDSLEFDLEGFTLDVDDLVVISGNSTTRELAFVPICVTNADLEQDTISGTTGPDVELSVWATDSMGEEGFRKVTADSSGNWTADFSVAGSLPSEALIVNISLGSDISVEYHDTDNDLTALYTDTDPPGLAFDPVSYIVYFEGFSPVWPVGTELTLTIDDVSNGPGIDFTDTVVVPPVDPDFNQFQFEPPSFPVEPPDVIEVTGMSITKQLIVMPLSITNIDLEQDTVSGTALGCVRLSAYASNNLGEWGQRVVIADGVGNWSADFSVAGPTPDEELIVDIAPGSHVDIDCGEGDGDYMELGRIVPNPRLEVLEYADRVAIIDWPAGQTVHVSIDDPATGASPDYAQDLTPDQDESYYEFLAEYDIQPGDMITAANGEFTKTLEVAFLQATLIDADNGIVQGVAAPNVQFEMEIWGDQFNISPVHDLISVDGSGHWSADYSEVPGGVLPWTWSIRGNMRQADEDGDVTLAYWHRHWGVLEIWMQEKELRAYDWEVGTLLTFTVDDPTTPQPVDFTETRQTTRSTWVDHGEAAVAVNGIIELQPGMIVTVTDGTKTKTTVIQDIGFNQFDTVNNIVAGNAPANAPLEIVIDKGYWSHRYFSADANGAWQVDYDTPDAGGRTLDLEPGDRFQGLLMRDEEFDSTVVSASVSSPHIMASAQDDWVQAREWQAGTTVHLIINGVSFGNAVLVDRAPWDSSSFYTQFDLGGYDVQVGDVITVEGAGITKELIVSPLRVTDVDLTLDLLLGEAAPGASVVASACIPGWGCVNRSAVADLSSGVWSADFQGIADLTGENADGWVQEWDSDGDGTEDGWQADMPFMDAWYRDGVIHAYAWPLGTHLTLTIEDPGMPASPDYSMETDVTGYTSWDPTMTLSVFQLNGAFVITPGMTLTISGASQTRQLVISHLTITDINVGADTITGTAEPNQWLWMWYDSPAHFCCRSFQADSNGVWTVDYSEPGPNGEPVEDIGTRAAGTINASDIGGDNTSLNWNLRIRVASDFDGDGDTDLSVYRSSLSKWFVKDQTNGAFGMPGDIPVPADYDDDGDSDWAVFRPTTGKWFVKDQANGYFGMPGDIPVPADYDGDGDADWAVFRPTTGKWFVKDQGNGYFGMPGDIPVPADYDGDGDSDWA